jgi:hypothetical protein
VEQIGAIEDVGQQFLRCIAQHDRGHSGALGRFDQERETGAAE